MKKLILMAVLIAAPAFAQPRPLNETAPITRMVETVAGWTISEIRSECSADTVYAGGMFVSVRYEVGPERVIFYVSNDAWESLQDAREYPFALRFSNGSTYNNGRAIGARGNERSRALISSYDAAPFLGDLALSTWMEIRTGTNLLGNLNLTGTRAMVLRLSACAHAAFRRNPPDPFSSIPGTVPGVPIPLTPLPSLIRDSDYPASSLRLNEEGTVGFRLSIGADGRVTGCAVTSSSGYPTLDQTTCRIMTARALFQAGSGTYVNSRLRWRLEVPLPPPPVDMAPRPPPRRN